MGGSSWFRPSSLGRARSSGSCLEVPRPSSGWWRGSRHSPLSRWWQPGAQAHSKSRIGGLALRNGDVRGPVRDVEQGDHHIRHSGDDDDHRPCRAPGRRWPWPVALHRLRLIDAIAFAIGEWVTGRARLTPRAGPALPGLNDFAFSAYFDGIGANGFFYGAPSASSPVTTDQRSVWDSAVNWLDVLRSGIGDRIREILPGDTGAFVASPVTDERRATRRNRPRLCGRRGWLISWQSPASTWRCLPASSSSACASC